jgi:DNA-binding response OmpR family regulator
MRILYVEEDQDSCELLVLLLGDSEHEVATANTKSEGLRLAKSGTFDAYVLGDWFSDGSGLELCRELRLFDPNTPIIFYSALSSDRDRQAAMSAGVQAYLIKPDGLEQIEPTIKRLIGDGKAKRSSP